MGIRKVQERVYERIEKVPGWYVDGTVKASCVAERGRQREIENNVVMCVCVCVHAFFCACVHACVCVCMCATFCACIYNLCHLVPTKREALLLTHITRHLRMSYISGGKISPNHYWISRKFEFALSGVPCLSQFSENEPVPSTGTATIRFTTSSWRPVKQSCFRAPSADETWQTRAG